MTPTQTEALGGWLPQGPTPRVHPRHRVATRSPRDLTMTVRDHTPPLQGAPPRDHTDRDAVLEALADLGPEGVCRALGLLDGAWTRDGAGVRVLCPWHSESRPACRVWLDHGALRAYCHACTGRGDGIGLVAAVRGIDARGRGFVDALAAAAELVGVSIGRAVRGDPAAAERAARRAAEARIAAERERAAEDRAATALDVIARVLIEDHPCEGDPATAAYLAGRGVLPEVRGYWAAIPTDRRAQDRARAMIVERIGEEAWAASGFARSSDPSRWLTTHRLCIPWERPEHDGRALLQRRVVPPATAVIRYLYPRGARISHPYGWRDAEEALGGEGQADEAVVWVEGAMDVVAGRRMTRPTGRAVAHLGLPGLRWDASWANITRGRVVLVALDVDASPSTRERAEGIAATIVRDCLAAGAVYADRTRPVGGKDLGEVLQGRMRRAAQAVAQ